MARTRARTIASAPGKVVLSGEYAVLDGAPAICMAVNRRARVVVDTTDAEFSTVEAPGYTSASGRFQASDGVLRWTEGQDDFGVVDAVWRVAGLADKPSHAIALDSGEFIDSDTGQKIGIGSSAAITVALVAATQNATAGPNVARLAQRAHAALQGGVGSGVDVACSLSGGLIEYRMESGATVALRWPDGLLARLIWTGRAASTREKLSLLDAAVSKPSRVRLAGASEDIATAWRSGSAREILSQYHHYIECLQDFSVDHDLGIFDAGHADILQAAKADNLIYKPCGAGGGDVGIVLGTDEQRLDTFARQLTRKYRVLDWQLSNTGAILE
jgi:phosphomevalonate kinase